MARRVFLDHEAQMVRGQDGGLAARLGGLGEIPLGAVRLQLLGCSGHANSFRYWTVACSRHCKPSFFIRTFASTGARSFTSVLSKKQYTGRGRLAALVPGSALIASSGSAPADHAEMRSAHRCRARGP